MKIISKLVNLKKIFKKFRNITGFEEHLGTAASIKCYFDKINLKQSELCTTSSFKILASKRKYENNIRNCEAQKNIFKIFHVYNVYVHAFAI